MGLYSDLTAGHLPPYRTPEQLERLNRLRQEEHIADAADAADAADLCAPCAAGHHEEPPGTGCPCECHGIVTAVGSPVTGEKP